MSNDPIAFFDDNGTAVFRASAIGMCEGALVRSLRGLEGAEPPEAMQRRFQDGHLHEPAIIAYLITSGWQVLQDKGQEAVRVSVADNIIIQGHVDGIAIRDGKHYVVECKSMSDAMYKKWMNQGFDAFPKYAMQISVYMTALQLPALYAVKNKDNGEIDVRIIEKPPYLVAKLKAKAIRVVRTSATANTPACPKPYDYPCPFYAYHDAPEKAEPVEPGDLLNDDIDNLCVDLQSAKTQTAYWKDRVEEIRDRILEAVQDRQVAQTKHYDIKVTVVKQRRLNTGRLRAAFPDLSQFENETTSTRLDVDVRDDNVGS